MAIEIRELHIKATVGTDTGPQPSPRNTKQNNEEERESLIALCVERVMEILARSKER